MTRQIRLSSNTRLLKISKSELQCHGVLYSVPLRGPGCVSQVTFNFYRAPWQDLWVSGNPFHLSMVLPQPAILGDQCWNTTVNVLESVTHKLNLCQFQNPVPSKIVPAVVWELGGCITKRPISMCFRWPGFSLAQQKHVRLSRMVPSLSPPF